MKNVLIPTSYDADTLCAIDKALILGGSEPFEIVLLRVTAMPDSIMDFLVSNEKREMPPKMRDQLMEYENRNQVIIREHHQYGASFTLLEQIIQKFEVGLIVIPYSFTKSKEVIEQEAMETLQRMNLRRVMMPQSIAKDHLDYSKGFIENKIEAGQ